MLLLLGVEHLDAAADVIAVYTELFQLKLAWYGVCVALRCVGVALRCVALRCVVYRERRSSSKQASDAQGNTDRLSERGLSEQEYRAKC